MANKTVEELRTELKDACEKYETRYSGMEYLVNYYITSLKWTEKEALQYVIDLFKNGTIEQIKIIDKDGKLI
jgi:hypothetical protein